MQFTKERFTLLDTRDIANNLNEYFILQFRIG
jgi:hypothetical protein